jgi:hypothetical protein
MTNYREKLLFVVQKIYRFFMYITCRTKPNVQDKLEYNKMYDLDDYIMENEDDK